MQFYLVFHKFDFISQGLPEGGRTKGAISPSSQRGPPNKDEVKYSPQIRIK
jgi:hypothetical protein